MKHIHACEDCGAVLTTRDEIRAGMCGQCVDAYYDTAQRFVDAHIDLAAAVIGVPSRSLRDERGGEAA